MPGTNTSMTDKRLRNPPSSKLL